MRLLRWDFDLVARIEPHRDEFGTIIADHAHKRFANVDGLKLHAYGAGPFCQFEVATGSRRAGLYAFVVDGQLEYIGECEDVGARLNAGYGKISPRNCFARGQSTNCRINNAVYRAASAGRPIELFFLETGERFSIEEAIITILKPSWNRKMTGRRPRQAPSHHRSEHRIATRTQALAGNACRDQVLTSARAIVAAKGTNSFSVAEVVNYLIAAATTYKTSTIRTHVTSVCCRNAPIHHGTHYDDFERISHGVYRLVT